MGIWKQFILLALMIVLGNLLYTNYNKKELSIDERKVYNIYKDEGLYEETEIAQTTSIKETTELKILNYNIHRGKDANDKYTLSEIINFMKKSDADIICFQEVLFSQHIAIRDNTEFKSQFVANINIPIASTGVATYSKYPIIESNHVKLTSEGEQRGALHTVFKIDGKIINVINVHLGLGKQERATQKKEILEYANKLQGEVIITGDFNQLGVNMEGFIDVGKYHGYEEYSTFKAFDSRIDYVFMSNDEIYTTSYERVDIDLSDHYPIVAHIKYKPDKIIPDDAMNSLDFLTKLKSKFIQELNNKNHFE